MNPQSTRPAECPADVWWYSTVSRKRDLVIPDYYSAELRRGVSRATAWELKDRPDPVTMVTELRALAIKAGFNDHTKMEKLPDWSTRLHDYFGKAEEKTTSQASGTS